MKKQLFTKHIEDFTCENCGEFVKGNGFTGSMLGVGCIDVQGDGVSADFTEIIYEEY